MKGITLSYDEKCQCSRDTFCTFIEGDGEFTEDEKLYLQKAIVNDSISGILYVIAVLAGWSVVAFWVDAMLIPGATAYSVVKGEVSLIAFAFPLTFLLANVLLKFIYIHISLRSKISLKDNFVAVLPYIGSVYLLREYLVKDKILTKAVSLYLKEQRNVIKRTITGYFKR